MSWITFFILVGIGLSAGLLGGMVGLGGGIILIPGLVIFLAMDQRTAQGTSLAIMLPPIGLLAAFNYYRQGFVNMKYAIVIALVFMIGSYFGSKIALNVSPATMKKIFPVVLVAVAAKMALGK
jgi:uncharacterized membrane protein YfcA